jgi:uncharacterized protein
MEPCGGGFAQRAGLNLEVPGTIIWPLSVYRLLPEPLRVAHLITGGVSVGKSTGTRSTSPKNRS